MLIDPVQAVERHPVPGASFDDLNLNLIREHITTAVRRRGYTGATDPEDYLLYHGCITTGLDGVVVPTLAGIVSFARDPNLHIEYSGIDIAQFRGSQATSNSMLVSRQVRGDMVSLVDQTVELLWALTEHQARLDRTERVQEDAYPMIVLRELTVNAIVHRDWSYAGTRIRIQLFPDRVEWISPGGFPGRAPMGVTFETLLNAQVSRNPCLAQVLYHAGRVEAFGLGLDTVAAVLQESGSPIPEVIDTGDTFIIRVRGRNLSPEANRVAHELTTRQLRIIAEIKARGRCTSTVLNQTLGENRRTIQRDLKDLITQGFVLAEGATSNRVYSIRGSGPILGGTGSLAGLS